MTKKLLLTSALVASVSGAAWAEGLERATFSSGFLFEEGTYVETSLGIVKPDFKPLISGVLQATNSIAEQFTVATLATKFDVSDNVAVGIKWTNGTNGVDINYFNNGATVVPPSAHVSTNEIQILGKYQASERFSIFGGAKIVQANGDINLNGATQFTQGSDTGVGAIIGAAFEIPDIALRIAASLETDIDLTLPTTANGAPAGNTTASIGDAIQVEFQTGIAQDTLLFGKIRRSIWADNQVTVPGVGQVSDFEDGNSFSLGIARRFSDSFAMSISAFYDPGDGTDASALAPQGETKSLSIGGRFTMENGTNISVGVSHSKRGDATVAAPFDAYTFTGSTVTSVGVSVSKNFQ